jgi:uncharacterized protein GlcG (DUF336 family)
MAKAARDGELQAAFEKITQGGQAVVAGDKVMSRTRGRRRRGGGGMVKNVGAIGASGAPGAKLDDNCARAGLDKIRDRLK